MELVWATDDYKIMGRGYPGLPILLHDDMSSCTPANEFMRYYLLRGSIGSKRSWPSTGRAMYDYFSFLEVHELQWSDVHRGEDQSPMAAYRDYCLDTIGLSRNTVRQRLLYVGEFYEYALEQGWIQRLPFRYERRGRGWAVGAQGALGQKEVISRSVAPKARPDLPKFLSADAERSLIAAAENEHHRMIIRFALQTGLRREEIATFPTAYVSNPVETGSRNIAVHLNPRDGHGIRTKGSKPRTIYFSLEFMAALRRYVVQRRGLRAGLAEVDPPQLFVSKTGEPFAQGGKGIERIVRETGRRVGIQVYTHMLRHTYATRTLAALQRQNVGINPLVFVQRQLGHASIRSTMVYLHLVNQCVDQAVLAYDDELNGPEAQQTAP